jgi:hypothetical protein
MATVQCAALVRGAVVHADTAVCSDARCTSESAVTPAAEDKTSTLSFTVYTAVFIARGADRAQVCAVHRHHMRQR